MTSTVPISEQLRRAIEKSGMSRYKISQVTGISESVLSRFIHGETGLNLETVDTLCLLLGARLVVKPKPSPKKKR